MNTPLPTDEQLKETAERLARCAVSYPSRRSFYEYAGGEENDRAYIDACEQVDRYREVWANAELEALKRDRVSYLHLWSSRHSDGCPLGPVVRYQGLPTFSGKADPCTCGLRAHLQDLAERLAVPR